MLALSLTVSAGYFEGWRSCKALELQGTLFPHNFVNNFLDDTTPL